jgi:hypothetical protein
MFQRDGLHHSDAMPTATHVNGPDVPDVRLSVNTPGVTSATGSSALTATRPEAPSPAGWIGRILSTDTATAAPRAAAAPAPLPNPSADEHGLVGGRFTEEPTGPNGEPRLRQEAGLQVDGPGRTPFEQLVRSIRLNNAAERSSARIWLEPPELGPMHVDVRVAGKQVRIGVRTYSAAAQERVAGRVTELSDALERQGITVESLEVTLASLDRANAVPSGAPVNMPNQTVVPEQLNGQVRPRAFDTDVEGPAAEGDTLDVRKPRGIGKVTAEPRLDVRV